MVAAKCLQHCPHGEQLCWGRLSRRKQKPLQLKKSNVQCEPLGRQGGSVWQAHLESGGQTTHHAPCHSSASSPQGTHAWMLSRWPGWLRVLIGSDSLLCWVLAS